MAKNDDPVISPTDVIEALHLLTRLPVPFSSCPRGASAAWAYPMAGLVVGALAAATGLVAHAMGLPAPLCGLFALASIILSTGALHEDGLADTADGLWGGWTPERRLEIMKDSRIGAYGVIALFLGLSARWAALWMLFSADPSVAAASLLVAATASRAMLPPVMAVVPNARQDGLSAQVGDVPLTAALVAVIIALIIAVIFSGWGGLMALIWASSGAFGVAWLAMKKIGGQTGDILGATQQVAEIAILMSLVA